MRNGHGDSHGDGHGDGDGGGHRDAPRNPTPLSPSPGLTLFIDAFSGVAGDMLVAALLDLGVPREVLIASLDALPFGGYRLGVERVTRSGIVAPRFVVDVDEGQPGRDYAEIRGALEAAPLSASVKARALDAFLRLARAEAEVHGTTLDHVHFHEVGAIDSIVDVVAACAGLAHLGARVVVSPLPMGRGFTRAEHGVLPLPAPATVACLVGAPTFDAGIEGELVTPTGACLVAAWADAYARWPALEIARVAYGAGTRTLTDRPNVLRLVLGEEAGPKARAHTHSHETTTHVVVETNVDDLSGELAAYALERARAAGALDAWASPIQMKKGRPAWLLSALARRELLDDVSRVLLRETSSLGVRIRGVDRIERPRRILEVETRFGPIPIKIAEGDGLPPQLAPEHDACARAALEHDVPLKEIYAAALAAYAARTPSTAG